MTRSAIVAVAALAACTKDATVSPVIDTPPSNTQASPLPLDQVTLTIAHAGSPVDLVSQTFASGDTLVLDHVPFGDDLVVHMTSGGAVSYGRTCPFAMSASAKPPQPHLFFSRSAFFAELAFAPELRLDGTAMTYHDGSGLIVGGIDPSGAANGDLERFDPVSGELAVIAQLAPRTGAVVAPIGTGEFRVAVIGGIDPNGNGAAFVEVVEVDTTVERRVDRIDDAQMARAALTATSLVGVTGNPVDGSVIVIGGAPPNMAPSGAVDQITVSGGTVVVTALRAQLAHPRRQHTATRLGNDPNAAVLVAGGLDAANTPIAPAELFKPVSNTFSTTFSASMVVPRTLHQAIRMPDGSVMIVGGVDVNSQPVYVLEQFSLDAGFVQASTLLPVNAGTVNFTATSLPDGRVLIAGGNPSPTDQTPLATAFIASLNPSDGSIVVVPTEPLSQPRARHQATLLCDGTVLLTGGTTTPASAERYNPPNFNRR